MPQLATPLQTATPAAVPAGAVLVPTREPRGRAELLNAARAHRQHVIAAAVSLADVVTAETRAVTQLQGAVDAWWQRAAVAESLGAALAEFEMEAAGRRTTHVGSDVATLPSAVEVVVSSSSTEALREAATAARQRRGELERQVEAAERAARNARHAQLALQTAAAAAAETAAAHTWTAQEAEAQRALDQTVAAAVAQFARDRRGLDAVVADGARFAAAAARLTADADAIAVATTSTASSDSTTHGNAIRPSHGMSPLTASPRAASELLLAQRRSEAHSRLNQARFERSCAVERCGRAEAARAATLEALLQAEAAYGAAQREAAHVSAALAAAERAQLIARYRIDVAALRRDLAARPTAGDVAEHRTRIAAQIEALVGQIGAVQDVHAYAADAAHRGKRAATLRAAVALQRAELQRLRQGVQERRARRQDVRDAIISWTEHERPRHEACIRQLQRALAPASPEPATSQSQLGPNPDVDPSQGLLATGATAVAGVKVSGAAADDLAPLAPHETVDGVAALAAAGDGSGMSSRSALGTLALIPAAPVTLTQSLFRGLARVLAKTVPPPPPTYSGSKSQFASARFLSRFALWITGGGASSTGVGGAEAATVAGNKPRDSLGSYAGIMTV